MVNWTRPLTRVLILKRAIGQTLALVAIAAVTLPFAAWLFRNRLA
jgi:ABC-type methionine transport system permease subunit